MSNDSKTPSRPVPTPRVVQLLTQLAYDRKDHEFPAWRGEITELSLDDSGAEKGQKQEPHVEAKLTLTQAKDLVAVEFGFENWHHFKRLSKQHESIARKRPEDIQESFVIKVVPEIRDEDYKKISLKKLTQRVFSEDPPTEAVLFELSLFLESKNDKKKTKIGWLSGAFYFDNDSISLVHAFDAESGDLEAFASDFTYAFAEKATEDVFNLAYVSELYVDEEYNEGAFLSILIQNLTENFRDLVDAIYIDPAPVTIVTPSPRAMSFFWDSSKGRKQNIVKSLKELGFEPVGKGTYMFQRTRE